MTSSLEALIKSHRSGSLTKIEKGLEESMFSFQPKEFSKTWKKICAYQETLTSLTLRLRSASPEEYTAQANMLADRLISAQEYCGSLQESYLAKIEGEIHTLRNQVDNSSTGNVSKDRIFRVLRLASITGNNHLIHYAQDLKEQYVVQKEVFQQDKTPPKIGQEMENDYVEKKEKVAQTSSSLTDKKRSQKSINPVKAFVVCAAFASFMYFEFSCTPKNNKVENTGQSSPTSSISSEYIEKTEMSHLTGYYPKNLR